MPIYDYRCESCGEVYDVLHKVREVEEDVLCPKCGSKSHTRLLSASSFRMQKIKDPVPACASGGCCGGSCPMN